MAVDMRPFVPGYFKTLVNFGDALDPTTTQRLDDFTAEKTLGGNKLINSIVGLSIRRHGRLRIQFNYNWCNGRIDNDRICSEKIILGMPASIS